VALQVDVARRPFSFRGGSGRREPAPDPRAATWLEGLKNYYPGYYEDGECCTLKRLGRNAKIEFDFETEFNWHPVDSQRMLLWAMTQGRGEDFAEAMAKRHFEQRKSAVGGQWIQEAAEEVRGCSARRAPLPLSRLQPSQRERERERERYITIINELAWLKGITRPVGPTLEP